MNIVWPQGWSRGNGGITRLLEDTRTVAARTHTHQAKSDYLAMMLDVEIQSAAKLIYPPV